MGYGTGKDAITRWREAECKILTEICSRHGIQIAAPEKSRGSLTVEQYKGYAQVKEQVDEKKREVARLDEQYQEKTIALSETTAALADNQTLLETSARKVAQNKSINKIEIGKTFLGGKVTLSKEDYGTLSDLAKKQIADENKENELPHHTQQSKEQTPLVFLIGLFLQKTLQICQQLCLLYLVKPFIIENKLFLGIGQAAV